MGDLMQIVTFSGSGRKDSLNTKLIKITNNMLASYGAEPLYVDLKALNLPMYDGDVEANNFPKEVLSLKELFVKSKGILVACPEYNSAYSPLFKNAIDWLSRPTPGEQGSLSAFRGKTVGLLCASMGGLAGVRNLNQMRYLFGNIASIVAPNQFGLASAHEAFDENGGLKDQKQIDNLQKFVKDFVELTQKLS